MAKIPILSVNLLRIDKNTTLLYTNSKAYNYQKSMQKINTYKEAKWQ